MFFQCYLTADMTSCRYLYTQETSYRPFYKWVMMKILGGKKKSTEEKKTVGMATAPPSLFLQYRGGSHNF